MCSLSYASLYCLLPYKSIGIDRDIVFSRSFSYHASKVRIFKDRFAETYGFPRFSVNRESSAISFLLLVPDVSFLETKQVVKPLLISLERYSVFALKNEE